MQLCPPLKHASVLICAGIGSGRQAPVSSSASAAVRLIISQNAHRRPWSFLKGSRHVRWQPGLRDKPRAQANLVASICHGHECSIDLALQYGDGRLAPPVNDAKARATFLQVSFRLCYAPGCQLRCRRLPSCSSDRAHAPHRETHNSSTCTGRHTPAPLVPGLL